MDTDTFHPKEPDAADTAREASGARVYPRQTRIHPSVPKLDVNGGTVALDGMGPWWSTTTGLSRITNWSKLTEREREATQRRIAKRNAERLERLRAKKNEQARQARYARRFFIRHGFMRRLRKPDDARLPRARCASSRGNSGVPRRAAQR